MTIDLTRQLGIEFERRVQLIDPTMEIAGKMDTDDIYSFLNQYQLQYVKSLYIADGLALSQTRLSNKILDIIKPLLKHLAISETKESEYSSDFYHNDFELPSDYFSYVRSTSDVSETYNGKSGVVPNIMMKLEDAAKVIESFYDEGKILRNPVCTFANEHTLRVIHDHYTTIDSVDLTYIKHPSQFGVSAAGVTKCELPYECFEDLVTGAVELWFNYKYKVSLASQAARRNAARRELGTDQPQQLQQQTLTLEAEE